jgi:hypothetical protein
VGVAAVPCPANASVPTIKTMLGNVQRRTRIIKPSFGTLALVTTTDDQPLSRL